MRKDNLKMIHEARVATEKAIKEEKYGSIFGNTSQACNQLKYKATILNLAISYSKGHKHLKTYSKRWMQIPYEFTEDLAEQKQFLEQLLDEAMPFDLGPIDINDNLKDAIRDLVSEHPEMFRQRMRDEYLAKVAANQEEPQYVKVSV